MTKAILLTPGLLEPAEEFQQHEMVDWNPVYK